MYKNIDDILSLYSFFNNMGVAEQKLLITGICELMSTMAADDGIKMLQNILLSTLNDLNKSIEENQNDVFLISEYLVRISVYIYSNF